MYEEQIKYAVENFFDQMDLNLSTFYIPLMNDLSDATGSYLKEDGNLELPQLMTSYFERNLSGLNFQNIVMQYGSKLFGSAKWKNEEVLVENDFFRLNYIPVPKGIKKTGSIFMVGGYIPYTDNLFRYNNDMNLWQHFLNRGISIYEMKMKNEETRNPILANLTHEINIETVHQWSKIAFEHNKNEKMILMGYCGTGIMQLASYLADLKNMSEMFPVYTSFVSPLNGRKCFIFSKLLEMVNKKLAYNNQLSVEYIKGEEVVDFIDKCLERSHSKTAIGYYIHGWKDKTFHNIKSMDDLTEKQKIDVSSWYWLSPENNARAPMSSSLAQTMNSFFFHGIKEDGILPFKYKKKTLNLHDINNHNVKMILFHGDRDPLIPPSTADILETILDKDKYQHVIQDKTAHIDYIFAAVRWMKDNPYSFSPNPIDLLLAELNKFKEK